MNGLKLFSTKEEESKTISEFKNPFQKGQVERVSIHILKTPSIFKENKCISCTVSFKNGSSSGEQEFFSNDLQEIFDRMNNFINAL